MLWKIAILSGHCAIITPCTLYSSPYVQQVNVEVKYYYFVLSWLGCTQGCKTAILLAAQWLEMAMPKTGSFGDENWRTGGLTNFACPVPPTGWSAHRGSLWHLPFQVALKMSNYLFHKTMTMKCKDIL